MRADANGMDRSREQAPKLYTSDEHHVALARCFFTLAAGGEAEAANQGQATNYQAH